MKWLIMHAIVGTLKYIRHMVGLNVLVVQILRKMKEVAEAFLGEPVEHCVVTGV